MARIPKGAPHGRFAQSRPTLVTFYDALYQA